MKNVKFKLKGTALNYDAAVKLLQLGKLVSSKKNLDAGILFCQQPAEEVVTSVFTQFKRFPAALVNVFKMETPQPTSENNPVIKIFPTIIAVNTKVNEIITDAETILKDLTGGNTSQNEWFEVEAYIPDENDQAQPDQEAAGENSAENNSAAPDGNTPPPSPL